MIDNLRFFTSIYCWVVFNEGWGQFDTVRLTDLVKKRIQREWWITPADGLTEELEI